MFFDPFQLLAHNRVGMHSGIRVGQSAFQGHRRFRRRGDLALAMPDNLVHGSDSPESAEREIALWFSDSELV